MITWCSSGYSYCYHSGLEYLICKNHCFIWWHNMISMLLSYYLVRIVAWILFNKLILIKRYYLNKIKWIVCLTYFSLFISDINSLTFYCHYLIVAMKSSYFHKYIKELSIKWTFYCHYLIVAMKSSYFHKYIKELSIKWTFY